MRFLRTQRSALTWIISLALLISMVVTATVPSGVSAYPRQVHDAVLGWLTLCAPSDLDDAAAIAAKGTPQNTPSQKHECCTSACAATPGLSALQPAVAEPAFANLVASPTRHSANASVVRSRRGFGTLGGRGPPLTA